MQEGAKLENKFEIESAAVSDRGLNDSRPENEDSYLDQPDFGIFAVADGVGGAQAGEVASQMAVEILSEAFTNMTETADPEGVMRAAISKANEAIFEMSSALPQLSRMATTIVALHLRGDVATIGHVGDSRLYRIGPNGGIAQETADHSIVAEEVRAGRMTEEQAAVHPSRNIISRALGAEPSVEIDLKTMMVEQGTTFLLCTDGVTRHVGNDEITQIVRGNGEPASACGRLKDICYERGAEDNLTAVLVRVGHVDQATSQFLNLEEEDEDTIMTARDTGKDIGFAEGTGAARFDIVEDEGETIDFEPEGPDPELAETGDVTAEEDATIDEVSPRPYPAAQLGTVSLASQPVERRSRGISFGNILGMILFLLIGAALGAGGYYYWTLMNPPVAVIAPTINEMKSNDIPLTSFEESRRLVDKDPRKFIAANQNPREADDLYLQGRAYLLTGEYFMARNAFRAAKGRLSEIDPRDRQTVSNDIEIALAIIASRPATENFTKAVANASASANSNSASNSGASNR